MSIWKIDNVSNDFTPFVYLNKQDVKDKLFFTDGTPKNWATRPKLQPFIEKVKKKQMPVADIGYISPGSILLNTRAFHVLRDFLRPFGELLEVECINVGGLLGEYESVIYYFYNVTNMISCIDLEKSEKFEGIIEKEAFFSDAMPKDIQIFKDPLLRFTNIYLSKPAKECFSKIIEDNNLTGIKLISA